MKKITLLVGTILAFSAVKAQFVGTAPAPLTTTQNVGIGVTTPTQSLDVLGSGKFSDGIFLDRPSNDPYIDFKRGGTNLGQLRGFGTTGLGLYSLATGNYGLFMGSANGFVGLGTTIPQAKLHIPNGEVIIGGNNGLNQDYLNNFSLVIRSKDNTTSYPLFVGVGPVNGTGLFWVRGNGDAYMGGNVGVGVTNPTVKLHVNATGSGIRFQGIGEQDGYVLTSDPNGNATWKRIPAGSGSNWTKTGNDLSYVNGKVGIGTATPKELVQFGDRFVFYDGGTKILANNFTYDGVLGDKRIISNAGSGQLRFSQDGTFEIRNAPAGPAGVPMQTVGKFIMDVNGNVGIGTVDNPNPLYKLSVNGGIRAKEVVVETGWADYVFADGYKLKSLEEVDQYVKENKHLPNVPSELEVKENGVAVAEMLKIQQEKIEELTLYIIEINKQLQAQKAELNKLQTK